MNKILKRAKQDPHFRKYLIQKLSSNSSLYQPKTRISIESVTPVPPNSLEVLGVIQIDAFRLTYKAVLDQSKDKTKFHVYTKNNLFLDYFLTGFFNSPPIYSNLLKKL